MGLRHCTRQSARLAPADHLAKCCKVRPNELPPCKMSWPNARCSDGPFPFQVDLAYFEKTGSLAANLRRYLDRANPAFLCESWGRQQQHQQRHCRLLGKEIGSRLLQLRARNDGRSCGRSSSPHLGCSTKEKKMQLLSLLSGRLQLQPLDLLPHLLRRRQRIVAYLWTDGCQ